MTAQPQIRGPLMSATIKWLRGYYGEPFFARALSRLTPDEIALLSRPVLTLGWYPISLHQRLMDACYDERCKEASEDRDTFDQRALVYGGGSILESLYRFVLTLMQPHNTLGRLPSLYHRVYDQGRLEILENAPGRAVLRHSGAAGLYVHAKRVNQFGLPHLLGMAGAKDVSLSLRLDQCTERDGYCFETVVTYRA